MGHYRIGRTRDILISMFQNSKDETEKIVLMNLAKLLDDMFNQSGVDVLDTIPDDKIFLNRHEKKVHSQFGEDGILDKIFETIGTTNKFYLDFGATEAEGNTQWLHLEKGFSGVLWNGEPGECSYNTIHKEFITVENIGSLCNKYEVPSEIDLLSIDIDGNDWYVWREITKHIKPRVVVIEYNGQFDVHSDKIIPYDPTFSWDHTSDYCGATLQALVNLGKHLGYSLVCCTNTGNNAFFVRNDLHPEELFYGVNDIKLLYRSLKFTANESGYFSHREDAEWVSSVDMLDNTLG